MDERKKGQQLMLAFFLLYVRNLSLDSLIVMFKKNTTSTL